MRVLRFGGKTDVLMGGVVAVVVAMAMLMGRATPIRTAWTALWLFNLIPFLYWG